MNDIFADMIDINVIVYLDDILVYSDDLTEHKRHVREVLQRLHANGLFTCADKCEFHITSCKYLGYMLSPNGVCLHDDWCYYLVFIKVMVSPCWTDSPQGSLSRVPRVGLGSVSNLLPLNRMLC